MKKRLTIALVAHDNRKADMVEWVKHNAELLSHHHLVCTGTTGRLIKEAFDELNIPADVTCMNSGPLGGDAEIAALVVRHQVDLAIFLIDDLNLNHTRPIYRCCFVSVEYTMCLSLATDTVPI